MPFKVLDHATFTNREGERVNRLALDVNGHDVQVVQYDGKPTVYVWVDLIIKSMDISRVGNFIAAHTHRRGTNDK